MGGKRTISLFFPLFISFSHQDIAGLDANQLLSDRPEARVTQLQTLTDIARDVEADQVYQFTRNRLATNVRFTKSHSGSIALLMRSGAKQTVKI